MTVAGVLTYLGELKGLDRPDAEAAVMRWLKEVELLDWAARKVHDLSRGMQQRLQFVATVLHDPDLLILMSPPPRPGERGHGPRHHAAHEGVRLPSCSPPT